MPSDPATTEADDGADGGTAGAPSALAGKDRFGRFLAFAGTDRFGRFIALGGLGAGGMGMVLAAYDPELDRRVALKLLHSFRGLGPAGETARLRLLREAQAMARLSHPNVVTVYEVGVIGEQVYIAMELVDGETLRRWLTRERRPWRAVVEAFVAAGRGLAAAHGAGLVHRDFKPDNVLVGADGRIRVVDFGVASASSRPVEAVGLEATAGLDAAALGHGLTVQGGVVGTPVYMAPEQHDGEAIDARADQFAFCVALHEGLYGVRPFEGKSFEEIGVAKRGRVPDAPAGSRVPAWLRAVVLRGLSPRPADRHPSMEALLRALGRDPVARRRRVAMAAAAALLCGVVGWGLARGGSAPVELCTGAEAQLAGVWDAAARQRLETAFLATGVPFAADSANRVGAALDRYASDWTAMRTEACRATRVRGDQSEQLLDLRVACLDRRRSGLEAMVGVLAGADADVVQRAPLAVSGLEPLAACADGAALIAGVAPPRGLLARARVDAIHAGLDRVAALISAGKYQAARVSADRLVRPSDETGHAGVRARSHLLLGRALHLLKEPDPAERELLAATDLAAQAHDDRIASNALRYLSFVYADSKGSYPQAVLMARMAEAAAWRGGGDDLLLAAARLALAEAMAATGSAGDALVIAETSLASYERRVGPNDPRLITALKAVSDIAIGAGQLDKALAAAERALAITTAAYGEDHPDVADVLTNLGNIARGKSDYRLARTSHERALAIYQKNFGPDSLKLANALSNLGSVALMLGDLDTAEQVWQRALSIEERRLGPEHRDVGDTLLMLGQLRTTQGRYGEAQALMARALAISLEAYGPSGQNLAIHYGSLAYLSRVQRRYAEARKYTELELDVRAKAQGTDSYQYGETLIDLAELDALENRCAAAIPLLERGAALIEKALGAESPRLESSLLLRSQCLLATGHAAEAVPLLEHAIEVAVKANFPSQHRAASRTVLAQALWNLDRRRAGAEAELAEREFLDGGTDPGARANLAELRAWRRKHR